MDPLSDALQALRPQGAVLYRSALRSPWGFALAAGPATTYHVVLDGSCWLRVGGAAPVALAAGDLAVLPRGHAHSFHDAPGTPPVSLAALAARGTIGPDGVLRAGGGGSETTLVCGVVTFDSVEGHPLLDALPPLIVVRAAERAGAPWLEPTLSFLACEARSGRPGAAVVMAQLSGVVFVQAVRAHLAALSAAADASGAALDGASPDGAAPGGWLRALADPPIARALAAVHGAPSAPWTVAALAAEAGLSRTAFADRFRARVGEPPLTYVTRWRMVEAARFLRADRATVAAVAERVGYQSEAAFGRVFKRWMRSGPGAYRRQRPERLAA